MLLLLFFLLLLFVCCCFLFFCSVFFFVIVFVIIIIIIIFFVCVNQFARYTAIHPVINICAVSKYSWTSIDITCTAIIKTKFLVN